MSMRVILSVTITGENEKSKLKHVVDKHSIDRMLPPAVSWNWKSENRTGTF